MPKYVVEFELDHLGDGPGVLAEYVSELRNVDIPEMIIQDLDAADGGTFTVYDDDGNSVFTQSLGRTPAQGSPTWGPWGPEGRPE